MMKLYNKKYKKERGDFMPLPLVAGMIISGLASQLVDGVTDIATDIGMDSLNNALNKISFNGTDLGSVVGNQLKFRASMYANSTIMQHSFKYANKLENHLDNYRDDVKTKIQQKKSSAGSKVLNIATMGKLNKGLSSATSEVYDEANKRFNMQIQNRNTAINQAQTFTQGNRALKNTYDVSAKRFEDLTKIYDPNIIKLLNAMGYMPAKGSMVGATT